jgi:SAM-dependent methyltransferase
MRPDEYFDLMTAEEWRPILGDDLHFHFGYFEDGMSLEEGVRHAVRRLTPYLDAGPGVLDIGCGWGGPARELAESGYRVHGVTNSLNQHAYCRSLGLQADLIDVEHADLVELGRFDQVFMMESLDHIFDKPRLLASLTRMTDVLVLVTTCNVFAAPGPIETFGGTCQAMSPAATIRTIEEAGWTVREAIDVRGPSMPTFGCWKARIDANGASQMKAPIRMLDTLCRAALDDLGLFERSFPLLVVSAERSR